MGAPSSSTGPTPVPVRLVGIFAGTWRSTRRGFPKPRKRRQSDSVRPSSVTVLIAPGGSRRNPTCASSASWPRSGDKALGEEDELRWWEERVVDALARREIDANTRREDEDAMPRRAGDGNRTRVLSLGNVSSRAQARALCCLVQQTVVALFAAPCSWGHVRSTAAARPRMVDYQSGATLTGTKPTPALRISFSVSLLVVEAGLPGVMGPRRPVEHRLGGGCHRLRGGGADSLRTHDSSILPSRVRRSRPRATPDIRNGSAQT